MYSSILSVAGHGDFIVALISDNDDRYDHDHGRVASVAPDSRLTDLLRTEDELRALWCSPSGAVWVGSANGVVATTAAIGETPASSRAYFGRCGAPAWHVASLPPIATTGSGDGLPPNIGTLWGRSDRDVFAATYRGHLYHWDGAAWSQVHDGAATDANSLSSFAATAHDLYAAGTQGTLLHSADGLAWRPVALPSTVTNESLVGVCALPGGEVLVAGYARKGSRLLRGTSTGLVELATTELELLRMLPLGERILFATTAGVAELLDGAITMIKSNFQTSTGFAAADRLFFLEPEPEQIGFIEHHPARAGAPWFRRKCA